LPTIIWIFWTYLVARASERGIYMLFSPIQLYSSTGPTRCRTVATGIRRRFGKGRMGTDSTAIRAQVNYLRQILTHVNPYTHVALKDEPNILFIELVNEPWHHPEDTAGSIRYINTLTDAVRGTGCQKLVFYNVSQDFRIGAAIRRSKAQGVTFGWYPTGLNSGHELAGKLSAHGRTSIRHAAARARSPAAHRLRVRQPRPAHGYDVSGDDANTFRSGGVQFAAMFSYDMLATASRNLGWQTHFLNMVYTARKTMSAIIAGEAMRRLPRMRGLRCVSRDTTLRRFPCFVSRGIWASSWRATLFCTRAIRRPRPRPSGAAAHRRPWLVTGGAV